MKKADGFITIGAIINCPYCDEVIDLLDHKEWNQDWGHCLLDHIIKDGVIGTNDLGFHFDCPECKKVFRIGKLEYEGGIR